MAVIDVTRPRTTVRPERRRRRLLSAITALGMLISTLFLAPAAHATDAAPALVTCLGQATQNYSPGLTLTPRLTTISSSASLDCLGSPDAVSTSFGPVSTQASCLLGDLGGPTTVVYRWSDGSTSTIDLSFVVTRPLGQTILTGTGTVTVGLYQGSLVQVVYAYISPSIAACLSPSGVSQVSGPVSFTVLG